MVRGKLVLREDFELIVKAFLSPSVIWLPLTTPWSLFGTPLSRSHPFHSHPVLPGFDFLPASKTKPSLSRH